MSSSRTLLLDHLTASLGPLPPAAADLCSQARPADLAYAIGFNPCRAVVNNGILRAPHCP